jgi:hypothetical protein
MTTETYETLHKNYVKKPYRMSNKKDYMSQIVKTVCFNFNYYLHIYIYLLIYLRLNGKN